MKPILDTEEAVPRASSSDHRPQLWPGVARAAVTIVATATVVLLAAGCGGRSSSTGPSGSAKAESPSSPSAVAYSACIRSHAVPNFPDPGSGGVIAKADVQQLGVSSSTLQAAQHACAHLIPPTGDTADQQQEAQCATAGHCSQGVAQQWMSGLLKLAQCLRSHGEPNWPDPTLSSQGLPHFPYDQAGIDHHSPQVLARVQECVRMTGFQGAPLP